MAVAQESPAAAGGRWRIEIAGAPRRPGDGNGATGRSLRYPPGYVPGRSEAMERLHREIAAVARAPFPVLVLGETGVGKEHVARLVHLNSARAGSAFVALNCAAVPTELLEAELFGVQEGVATGVRARPGSFLEAEGGTLFLDEIAETAPHLQAKLLRVLQEREVRPLGGRPRPLDVRVLSATNADLARRREGRLRDDLYYRLAGHVLRVPPLRERREDVPLLVRRFAAAGAVEAGKRITGVPPEVIEFLCACPWPGNVRQLEHEVLRLVYLAPEGGALDPRHLSPDLLEDGGAEPEAPGRGPAEVSLVLHERVERLERRLIRAALARSGGGIAPAARLLGVSRNGLKAKARRLGIPL